jgi:hypothetical protein
MRGQTQAFRCDLSEPAVGRGGSELSRVLAFGEIHNQWLTMAASWIAARKLAASLSQRVAMRRSETVSRTLVIFP